METPADELDEALAAAQSDTMGLNDLIEALDSEIATRLISSELYGHQQQSDFQGAVR